MAPGFYMVLARDVLNCETRLSDLITWSEYKNKNFIEHRPLSKATVSTVSAHCTWGFGQKGEACIQNYHNSVKTLV